jgi:hypothetical protein
VDSKQESILFFMKSSINRPLKSLESCTKGWISKTDLKNKNVAQTSVKYQGLPDILLTLRTLQNPF